MCIRDRAYTRFYKNVKHKFGIKLFRNYRRLFKQKNNNFWVDLPGTRPLRNLKVGQEKINFCKASASHSVKQITVAGEVDMTFTVHCLQ